MTLPDKEPLFTYKHSLRSRYSETDKMGYVYYGHFLQYFEVARTEMIRAIGISYAQLENDGFMLPVMEAELSYKSPVLYDEPVSIEVLVFDPPGIRLVTYYRVVSEVDNSIKTYGRVVLVFMSEKTRKPIRPPQNFIKAFENEL